MLLKDQLAADRARHTQRAEVHDAYEAAISELRRTGFVRHALRVGQAFPDFMLPNAEGRLVARDDLLALGPLVVVFFRGDWCPYCRLTLAALEEALPRIAAEGASLAAVTPDAGGRALATKQRFAAHFEVLSDVDYGLGLQCGVIFRTPAPYRALMTKFGTDLAERHGNGSWFLPVPATYVVDAGGTVRWASLDVDFTRRAEPDDILAALVALRA